MPLGRQEIYALFFAVIVGVFAAMLLDFGLDLVPSRERSWMGLLVGLGVTYLVFRFRTRGTGVELIPVPVLVLDTSALIDGRIAEVVGLGYLTGRLVVPPCVVGELQRLADSSDKHRRARGRRGLDVLDRLRTMPAARLSLDVVEKSTGDEPVDRRLVAIAKEMHARLVTQDFNLNKVAKVHGVEVVNLNELSTALRPACLPGERLTLQLVKPGEHAGQAVGYLDDGTMVVVEAGREHVGRRAGVLVTSVTQTHAGRMVFGRFEQPIDDAVQPA